MGFDAESRRYLDTLGCVNLELLTTSIWIHRFSIDDRDLIDVLAADLEEEYRRMVRTI